MYMEKSQGHARLQVKAMQAMKAKRLSQIAKGQNAKKMVFRGLQQKTVWGLKASDLMMNKRGKIVSKKGHASALKKYTNIKGWITAVSQARQVLGVKGFHAVKKGSPLYKMAKEIYGH